MPFDPKEITVVGQTNFRGQHRAFGIYPDDRRRHLYLIGKTGVGKTTLIQNMLIQDIQTGKGVALVDPHGDVAERVLDAIPPSRVNDVIYFNPSDVDWPVAFNVLEAVDPRYKYLVASGLVSSLKKIWADSWGPRLEYILRNVILALLDYPSSTMLGIMRMLADKTYRKKVVDTISDPVVKSFWVNEFANYNERFRSEAISPIQNKVGQFLSSSIVRNIVAQPKSTIDMKDIMDNGKILIINVSKGRIGEDNSALLGAMLITKIQLAAMDRASIPEEERRDFYLYVDEFQNFATESFATILSEARKYHLNLIIAHQYITQMEEEVRDAVFGNVGTVVSFRVGAYDAEYLEKEFAPEFTETDLVNLDKYNAYVKLMIDGVTSKPFSMQTIPPVTDTYNSFDKVINVSRERYGRKREDVEEKIARWSGVAFAGSAPEEVKISPVSTADRPSSTAGRPAGPVGIVTSSSGVRATSEPGASAPIRTPSSSAKPMADKPSSKPASPTVLDKNASGERQAVAREPAAARPAAARPPKALERTSGPAGRGGPAAPISEQLVDVLKPTSKEEIRDLSALLEPRPEREDAPREAGHGPDRPKKKRKAFPIICARCGKPGDVPFEPAADKPVYCRECFELIKKEEQAVGSK